MNKYIIRINKLKDSINEDHVFNELSKLFKKDQEIIRNRLNKGSLIAKITSDIELANKYKKALDKLGCVVELEVKSNQDNEQLLTTKLKPSEEIKKENHGNANQNKICPFCNSENLSEANFCDNCGAAFINKQICGSCSSENIPTAKFCSQCGAPFDNKDKINKAPLSEPNNKNIPRNNNNNNNNIKASDNIAFKEKKEEATVIKVDDHLLQQMTEQQRMMFTSEVNNKSKDATTAILLNLLLGGLGVHHFYLGRNLIGILYLLFCWTLIPLVISIFDLFFTSGRVKEYNKKLATDTAVRIIAAFPSHSNY
ncbi:MAG: NINE protein [Methylobacter sp.]